MKINCLIVDDEPISREGLGDYVARTPFLEMGGLCKNAFEAHTSLQEKEIDLIFLDIQMPDMTGLELVKSLQNPPLIIFTTAYREYASDGFDLDALDYLVKPISYQRFFKAADKALEKLETKRQLQESTFHGPAEDHFFIKADGKYIKILFHQILYLESAKDYIFIYTTGKRYMTLLSLKQVEQSLPVDSFIRVHRSFIVAKDRVDMLEGNMLRIGERKIPISRSLQEKIYGELIEGRLWKRGE